MVPLSELQDSGGRYQSQNISRQTCEASVDIQIDVLLLRTAFSNEGD